MLGSFPGTPELNDLVERVLAAWPEHEPFLRQRFAHASAEHFAFCEAVTSLIARVTGPGLGTAVTNYRWTCERLLEEERHFALFDSYRHTTFAEVEAVVYRDSDFMARYTDGLLLSQVLWSNQARALEIYQERFLAGLTGARTLLEVGPGHGLLLALAARRENAGLTGWDVSPGSIEATRSALSAVGVDSVRLCCADLLDTPATEAFDLVVASELIEHVDRPDLALRRLGALTSPTGLLFLNIPVNSPAPDHITLWRSPEEVFGSIEANGLTILEQHVFPMTGRTESEARRQRLTMSCVALCRPGTV
ncbi:2-polyprenyl-3-methyl-5-hydroxy-6-metoxy-1,4-benzoquinol methylase [Actinoalloteichus hoggarensis]|uniref:class I SAM-dependent methyltransferase n=1 Tax=Actinoalloteichus hoggarensis TaxID=1470176 RepID=UPI0012FD71B3|nr:class I SAM-dependent methyltransferase [Actinoalloteichus hoggarensis]MBB5924457.1 2-polyprenyl-3-methyl-5-hydroxy-6-metoxy-1,4-benzoquinol methylase [Actinoalloteichus hoggarensis]